MRLTAAFREKFFAALEAAGMPEVPGEFSVVPAHRVIPAAILAEIARFIRVFDTVTTRAGWHAAARRDAPPIAQLRRSEVCFFSAWDFHLPPGGGFELIEFNDNGSGFLFAAIINAVYHEAAGLGSESCIAAPAPVPAFNERIGDLVEQEARAFFHRAFFQEGRAGLFLILDDAQSLRQGKFRKELRLLCEVLRCRGFAAEIGSPEETRWDGERLLFEKQAVDFVVNRSTDFLWQSDGFAALRRAYEEGRIYVAPNPFTYITRSDKRLLEWLSSSNWDHELGIEPGERQILNAHAPETHLVRAENLERLAQRKSDFIFKPFHGFAGRGLIASAAMGRRRLRHLLKQGEGYVAQEFIPKPLIEVDGVSLWTDLRVWAYRGQIFLLSGRASRRPDRLDLTPPGGWLPTYAASVASL